MIVTYIKKRHLHFQKANILGLSHYHQTHFERNARVLHNTLYRQGQSIYGIMHDALHLSLICFLQGIFNNLGIGSEIKQIT